MSQYKLSNHKLNKCFKHILFVILFLQMFYVKSQSFNSTATLNLRDKPSINGNIIGKVEPGTKLKVDSLGLDWSKIEIEENQFAYVSSKYIEKKIENNKTASGIETQNNPSFDYSSFFIILFFVLFVFYIIAFIKSSKNQLIIIVGWFDFIVLIISFISFLLIFSNKKDISIVGSIIFLVALSITVYLTINANRGHYFNIALSILAKLFILYIIVLSILILVYFSPNHKKDNRYKDGTKGNSKSRWKFLVVSFVTLVIFKHVKNKDERKYVYQNE